MLEVFTTSPGSNNAPERTESNQVSLPGPRDVYFGPETPGIAFYEKVGSDLVVTLLDGSTIRLGNFYFVANPEGTFSRLLLGPDGAVEVTAVTVPEPLQPDMSVSEVHISDLATTEAPLVPESLSLPLSGSQSMDRAEVAPSIESTQVGAPFGEGEVIVPTAQETRGGGDFDFTTDQLIQVGLFTIPFLPFLIVDDEDGAESQAGSELAAQSDADFSADESEALFVDWRQQSITPDMQMGDFDQVNTSSESHGAEAATMLEDDQLFMFNDIGDCAEFCA